MIVYRMRAANAAVVAGNTANRTDTRSPNESVNFFSISSGRIQPGRGGRRGEGRDICEEFRFLLIFHKNYRFLDYPVY